MRKKMKQKQRKKNKEQQKAVMHPRNKYAENPPDFNFLAQKYPSFKHYVSLSSDGRGKIDWTDYNATRELTRVLLDHDYGLKWWIPDGHLCPTVPNRVNYIHWIEDLLSFFPSPHSGGSQRVMGLDIGTGTSCIYPLLGASLNGWSFVATDATPVALDWALKNVEVNQHIAELVTIRKACWSEWEVASGSTLVSENLHVEADISPAKMDKVLNPSTTQCSCESAETVLDNVGHENLKYVSDFKDSQRASKGIATSCHSSKAPNKNPPVLVGVVRKEETFDFCMCNPPFFERMEEAGANPRTACGGTKEEMVCPGGESGFITRIIEDSLELKNKIHWYSTMVGQKAVLKAMVLKLQSLGVATLRSTEFAQGRTSRWGLAWSFDALPMPAMPLNPSPAYNGISFLLEGGKCVPMDVLKALASNLEACGTSCKVNMASFAIDARLSCKPKNLQLALSKRSRPTITCNEKGYVERCCFETLDEDDCAMSFKVVVFQQAPGSVLIKASLLKDDSHAGNHLKKQAIVSAFTVLLGHVQKKMKEQFTSSVKVGV